ncbi:ABC transporter ATP-binding protein [Paracidovorax sp. MALMAid1276]|uniref:ABC transporter ATP-binding protein n=1 Tax=Paracidovorax sp. MALMAid1276 TaxID=3411631 RepID=UPI003B9CFCE5
MASSLDIAGINKRFGKGDKSVEVLRKVDIQVAPGEFLILVGPSGCGKSTLLNIIAGLDEPTEGEIRIGGKNVVGMPPRDRDIAMVFQSYALYPTLSVADNIGFALEMRKMPKAERQKRIDEVAAMLQIGHLLDRRPSQLSGGQRQRVALARAVAVRPRVLLLDEPLTALDAKLKESLRDELAELLRRLHITAIHVTHDQQEALALADRLAVMNAGQVVQVGAGETLYRAPAHPFVAQFLGRVNRLARGGASPAGALPLGGWQLPCPPALQGHAALLVRPEDIEVGATASAGPGASSGWGQAQVTRRSFLGDRVQLTLALADQAPLCADVARDHPARAGDTVAVRIAPERLMPCLEPEAAPTEATP